MANSRCVMVISIYIDISYSNVLRLYCCHSMQLSTIVSTFVNTSIYLRVTLNLCSRVRTTEQRDKQNKKLRTSLVEKEAIVVIL